MKKVTLEYGDGQVEVNLPDQTDVFETGVTVKDPAALKDPVAATKQAIDHPIGVKPIAEQVHKGSKVVIIFPDRVKGGYGEYSHRKVTSKIVVEECLAAGVEEKDILFICSNGLHRKNTPEEIHKILGDEIFNRFYPKGQIINHDSEDWDHLVDLGNEPKFGAKVVLNKYVYDADLAVMIGHVQGNPYGGYSGGYKHCATGISNWECISSHHCPAVMHRPDFMPVSDHSLMRQKFDAIGDWMEAKMGKKFFSVDAILDSYSNQIAVYAGYAKETEPLTWEIADKRTYVKWAKKKYDVLVFGLPNDFQYGSRQGRNPILVEQAIAAQLIRLKRVTTEHPVIIALAQCDGDFGDQEFPAMRPVYDYFMEHGNTLPEIESYHLVMNKPEYIEAYRFHYAFHPYHAFSMISCAHLAERDCAAVYIVGAKNPGCARAMGMKTRSSVEEALKDAVKYVGEKPNILALPMTFKRPSVHLCMADQKEAE
jgi:lactate racemase